MKSKIDLEKRFKEGNVSFRWSQPLEEIFGNCRSARKFVDRVIRQYDSFPLDDQTANLEGIPRGVKTPLDLLIYLQNNRNYEDKVTYSEYPSE